MSLPRSRVTKQGQISVPAEIRRKLGIGPGSVLEWDQDGEQVIVRRVGSFTSEQIHDEVFPDPPRPRDLDELNEGRREHARQKHARG